VPVLKYLLFLGVCALVGAVTGYLAHQRTACVWDAATVGVWVMCVFTLSRGSSVSALHIFLGVCALVGAVSGWLTYQQAACVWDAATVGVAAMCVFTLSRGLDALHIP